MDTSCPMSKAIFLTSKIKILQIFTSSFLIRHSLTLYKTPEFRETQKICKPNRIDLD